MKASRACKLAAVVFVLLAGASAAYANEGCPAPPGFIIRTIKAQYTAGFGYDEMNKLLDYGCTGPLCTGPGMPIPGIEEGEYVAQFVNLHDSGPRGAFSGAGFDDQSFPGIDPFESPTIDPAGGDDDDYFATEVTGLIYLTAGQHVIGVNSDDGAIIEIGGVEIGRTSEFKMPSNVDFQFEVLADGCYPLRVRYLEAGGGAGFELHEVLPGPKRILLNDVAAGGSPVHVPEPGTVVMLLGAGLMGLLACARHRRKR